ncbi:unnamed protein product [Protopolystoma xenopodis]|uniref:Uncharacterized protein n=1 Tax=Protopolystoma xenopodis TaxID=117903 RepID=A0A3S5BIG6_9PLAT|nr:unnamed protein product [Protopolystoma xenopodis]
MLACFCLPEGVAMPHDCFVGDDSPSDISGWCVARVLGCHEPGTFQEMSNFVSSDVLSMAHAETHKWHLPAQLVSISTQRVP